VARFVLYKKLLVSYKVKKIYSARPVAHWMCARAMAIRKLRAEGTIFLLSYFNDHDVVEVNIHL
ncbi:MAG: hypothetical protein IJR57_07290, partial [Ruminococcus sp.]|nr:hypothetical protein [Ruminococcus sp.]